MQEQPPQELVFEVTQEADGGYTAECLGPDIFTQGASWSELRHNVREPVEAYCFDRVVVPDHHELRIGTLNSVLRAVAAHKGIDRGGIIEQLR